MKLHYDWRMARVIDDDGVVIDEVIWTSKRSAGAVADRLFDLQRGRLSPEARVLAERFPEALVDAIKIGESNPSNSITMVLITLVCSVGLAWVGWRLTAAVIA